MKTLNNPNSFNSTTLPLKLNNQPNIEAAMNLDRHDFSSKLIEFYAIHSSPNSDEVIEFSKQANISPEIVF